MEEIIKRLYEAYEAAMKKFCETQKLFCGCDLLTTAALHEMLGLEEAFEIVAGMSPTDYFLKQV